MYSKYGIRRYGYHGTSHKYITWRAAELPGIPADEINLISCHLGNGASLAAVKGGKSIDTSMGFGTISGIPMGTRPGDVDPAVLLYLLEQDGMNREKLSDILYRESGLKGLSGLSPDMRDLFEAADRGDERSLGAIRIFVRSVQKYIGAYFTQMGGNLNALVFTAGIGENSPEIRKMIVDGLSVMGLRLNEEKNRKASGEALISQEDSLGGIMVIPTDEELMIARETEELVKTKQPNHLSLFC